MVINMKLNLANVVPFYSGIANFVARSRVRYELLAMDDKLLADAGFSRELLEQGVRAWPWHVDDESETSVRFNTASAGKSLSKTDYAKAVAELNAYSDAELSDLGLSRAQISSAVRHGRPGIDNDRNAA